MKTIHKFLLFRQTTIRVSSEYQVLSVAIQNGSIYAWILLDSDNLSKNILIDQIGTGWGLMDSPGRYINSIQDGAFVWHYFLHE